MEKSRQLSHGTRGAEVKNKGHSRKGRCKISYLDSHLPISSASEEWDHIINLCKCVYFTFYFGLSHAVVSLYQHVSLFVQTIIP